MESNNFMYTINLSASLNIMNQFDKAVKLSIYMPTINQIDLFKPKLSCFAAS